MWRCLICLTAGVIIALAAPCAEANQVAMELTAIPG